MVEKRGLKLPVKYSTWEQQAPSDVCTNRRIARGDHSHANVSHHCARRGAHRGRLCRSPQGPDLSANERAGRRRVRPEDGGHAGQTGAHQKTAPARRHAARGIHPAILTRSGLEPAIASLAERSPVPVDVRERDEGRLAPAIEAAAYFVVAEGLTTSRATREASRARVGIRGRTAGPRGRRRRRRGGPIPTPGAGCAGWRTGSRASAALAIDSPPGAGTRLEATIPSPAGQP